MLYGQERPAAEDLAQGWGDMLGLLFVDGWNYMRKVSVAQGLEPGHARIAGLGINVREKLAAANFGAMLFHDRLGHNPTQGRTKNHVRELMLARIQPLVCNKCGEPVHRHTD